MLHGIWTTKSGPYRNGAVELRGIRLSQRMIEAIKIEDIGINLTINGTARASSKYELLTDSFSELKVLISNRSSQAINPLLRLQPSVRHQTHTASLDLSKKIVWNGILQQALPILPAQEKVEICIGLTALARGEFEIGASVEEAQIGGTMKEAKTDGARPRANTKTMMDAVLGTKERRIWHAREPCLILVKDEDSDYE